MIDDAGARWRGVLGIACALAPPVLFGVAVWSATTGASAYFYVFFVLSIAATAIGVVLAVQLRRRGARGWFAGVVTTLCIAGVVGYIPWGFVVLLDAAARSGGIGP